MKITDDLSKETLLDLKTMIVFHKAERTIRAIEAQIFKKHDLTPTQFFRLRNPIQQRGAAHSGPD